MNAVSMAFFKAIIWRISFWIRLFLTPLPAHGVLFTLRSGSFLSTEPSYDVRTRLRLSAVDVLVESPPLREKGEFCFYRLFDEMGGSFEPETAWTPCFSINRLFERS